LGGTNFENTSGVAVDRDGTVYITGQVTSEDFPVTQDALQPAKAGGLSDAYLARVSPKELLLIVDIDIKPGNKRNVINPRAKGGIWVAILSDTDSGSPFDPSSQVDIPTVEFGPDGAKAIRHKVKDINRDGLGDLLLRFKIPTTGIACGDTEATLTGETFDGLSFSGTDLIKTVGCKPKKHCKKHLDEHNEKECQKTHHNKHHDDDHKKR
jgi:hypothetical protein